MNRLALLSALSLLFLGQGCWLLCIAEGSLISTPRGRCLIELLREGDTVYSVDTDTGELVEARIIGVRRGVRECMSFELCGGERLRCTPDHPLYEPDSSSYRVAGEWIRSGASTIARVVEGRVLAQAVTSVSAYVGLMEVFDLTVDGPHANFIADGVIVHNKSFEHGYDYTESETETETGGEALPPWLADTAEIPCTNPIPPGKLCLTIDQREYQLEVDSAAISDEGTMLTMVFDASGTQDMLPRLELSYAADAATAVVNCQDPNTAITLEFSEASLSSAPGAGGSCVFELDDPPASPGASVSGSLEAKLVEGVGMDTYAVKAAWVDVPVAE
jgi:hypothetical protein